MSAAAVTVAAFIRRDFAIARSYRLAFAITFLGTLFTLLMLFYVGQLVDSSTLTQRTHFQQGYFGFVVIGIALLRFVHVGLTSFGTKLRQEQTTGTFETVMASPVHPWLAIVSSGAYDLCRAFLSSVLIVLAGIVLFGLDVHITALSFVGMLAAAAACFLMFSAFGVLVAAFTVVFKQTTAALGLVGGVFAMLGGVYFPVALLPGALHALGAILPFTWGLDVMRGAVLNGDVDGARLAMLAAFDVVALPAALALFGLSVRHARRRGTLGHY